MAKKESVDSNAVAPTSCIGEGCKKKPEVAGFCEEHFIWFKEGMMTKMGKKPTDFDKKLINYMKRQKKAA